MPVVNELIKEEADSTISFGNYLLDSKSKVENFEHNGDLYKVKTFKEITKLERNGMFVYESVPGTTVMNLSIQEEGMEFQVEGFDDSQITVELEPDTEYETWIDNVNAGKMKTNLGGKLILSVELGNDTRASVKIVKA